MDFALNEAKKAALVNEVPVGCVIVKNGSVIAAAHNTTEKNGDATCHAEMNAIKAALEVTGEKVLSDCEMYVTLEPCAMCAGAIINTRIKRLYIGAAEPKSGCCGSVVNIFNLIRTHVPEIYFGINEDECKKIMKDFFKNKR